MISSNDAISLRNRVTRRLLELSIKIETPVETHVYQAAGIAVMHLRPAAGAGQSTDAILARVNDVTVAAGVSPRMYVDGGTGSVVAEFQMMQPPTLYTSMLLGSLQPYHMTIGRDVAGLPLTIDISNATTPHILVAGTTGAGKTAACHSAIATIAKATPRLKIITYDPVHPGFPWLMPYVKATLVEAVQDPERLLALLNQMVTLIEGGRDVPGRVLIYIDEVRDLIQACPAIVEPLTRIAQRGRQAGMHLLCATQNPSRKSLPPDLLTNLPARIVLAVADRAQSDMASGNQKIDAHKLPRPGAGVLVADGRIARFVPAIPDNYATGTGPTAAQSGEFEPEPAVNVRKSRQPALAAAPIGERGADATAATNFILPERTRPLDDTAAGDAPVMGTIIARPAESYTLDERVALLMAWNPNASITMLQKMLQPGGAAGGFYAIQDAVARLGAQAK